MDAHRQQELQNRRNAKDLDTRQIEALESISDSLELLRGQFATMIRHLEAISRINSKMG